jgi:hypothetical protein
MRRAKKVARRNRRKMDGGRRKTKTLMVASTCAAAGTMLVAMAIPAGADYTSPNGYIYHPGLSLQAGAMVTVTPPSGSDNSGLGIDGATISYPLAMEIAPYFSVAMGTVPLFADDGSAGGVTDCAGESITGGTATFAGCVLKTYAPWLQVLDVVPVTVAFPNVTQSATSSSGLSNGKSVVVKTNAQGDSRFAATDSVVVEECGPMPAGVVFDIHSCIGLGTMTPPGVDQGQGSDYMATVPVQDRVGSTTCATHSGSTSQCSLWTVEVHSDSTGRYWWPLANGIPISFK